MSIPTVPPPIYSQENETSRGVSGDDAVLPSEAQLLISPSGNASQFQKGYLGVNGERAAIEGELQIKGVPVDSWIRLYGHSSNRSSTCLLNYDVELFLSAPTSHQMTAKLISILLTSYSTPEIVRLTLLCRIH